MRIVFIGRKNFANHCFANWLAQRHELVAYFRADMTRYSSGYQMKWLQKRIQRKGLIRAVDEIAYQFYYSAFKFKKDQHYLSEAFEAYFGREAFNPPPSVPYYEFEDLNGPEALHTLRDLKPDLVFAACVSQYFKKPYMEIPRLGTVLYHEGLTPEYKGLHTAFWALYNGEKHRIGYTLLQLDSKIDNGRPLAQGVGKLNPAIVQYFAYAGHKTLMDGLPDVEKALAALEQGQQPGVTREHGPERMYSYPGLSDQIRCWLRTTNTQKQVPAQ